MFEENLSIIFDLDGTLWDASNQIAVAWNNILNQIAGYKKNITRDDIIACLGKTNDEIATLIFSDLSAEKRLKLIDKCACEEINVLSKTGGILFQNLNEILNILNKKYDLYIVSNCQSNYIETFLKYHNLKVFFKDWRCSGDTNKAKDENIRDIINKNNIINAIYVGDTLGDYLASEKNNLPFIYASYGFENLENMQYKIDKLENLPMVIKQIKKDKKKNL